MRCTSSIGRLAADLPSPGSSHAQRRRSIDEYGPWVNPDDDLAALVLRAERSTFHGIPADAIAELERAVVLAEAQGQVVFLAQAAWLLGVALAARGRFGAALTVLAPLVETAGDDDVPAQSVLYASLASATIASVHRQLGRHEIAQQADLSALALGEGDDEATFDALVGLVADAVGLGEVTRASERLAEAAVLLPVEPGDGSDRWWRQRIRLDWAGVELALLEGRSQDAVQAAGAAITRAEQAGAPRHVAKGLLFLGLAHLAGGAEPTAPTDRANAVTALRRAADVAEQVGAAPLIWPARALLGAVITPADERPTGEGAVSLTIARAAVLTIAEDLPPGVRAAWLARPDVAALLAG